MSPDSTPGLISSVPITVAVADTEYSLALPPSVIGLVIRNMSRAFLRFAFLSGKVADPTATSGDNFEVMPLQTYDLGEVQPGASTTLYYASTLRGARFDLDVEMGSI